MVCISFNLFHTVEEACSCTGPTCSKVSWLIISTESILWVPLVIVTKHIQTPSFTKLVDIGRGRPGRASLCFLQWASNTSFSCEGASIKVCLKHSGRKFKKSKGTSCAEGEKKQLKVCAECIFSPSYLPRKVHWPHFESCSWPGRHHAQK